MKTKRLGDGYNKNTIKIKTENYGRLVEIRGELDKRNNYRFRASMNDVIDYLLEIKQRIKDKEIKKLKERIEDLENILQERNERE